MASSSSPWTRRTCRQCWPPRATRRPCRTATASPSSRTRSGRNDSASPSGTIRSGSASSSRNGPIAVRSSSSQQASPRSAISDRTYVPAEHEISKAARSPSDHSSSVRYTVTRRSFVSTASPARAISYARLPPTFTAENAGGRCNCSPTAISSRCARVALPTRTRSRPVANGSSVPACPTFVPRGSDRRTSATTSCEVTPAGLARSRTPEGTKSVGQLLADELAQPLHELRVRQRSREARSLRVPAAPELAGDAGHVDAAVRGAQAHLAHPVPVRGQQLAHEHRHGGSLDGAHVVHHALGVGLEGAGRRVVVLDQVRDRDRAALEALDARQSALQQLHAPEGKVLEQPPVDLV